MSPAPPLRSVAETDIDTDTGAGTDRGPAVIDPTALPAPVAPARVSWWKIGAMGAAGLAGCAYVAFFDPNTASGIYPSCPFKVITGLDCPGCGITRALHALTTGNVGRALDHNLLFILALPVLLWWMVRGVLTSTGRRPIGPTLVWRSWMTWTLVGAVTTFWVVRNLPFAPFEWLAAIAS